MEAKIQKPGWLKSALLNWLGFRWTDVEQWKVLYGKGSATGERINAESAMKFSAVYACVRLISQTIATLPLNVYEKRNDGRVELNDHPIARLIRQKPNADMTAVVFWEAVVASILLQVGAYIEKKRVGSRIVALDFLHPLQIARVEERKYVVVDRDGTLRDVPREDIVYIPAFSTDGRCGKSVIEYGCEVVASGIAAQKAANTTFKNGLHPTVAFKYPQILKPDQRDQARETIKALSGAVNAGNPVILEAGMDAMTIGILPKDAQLLESRISSAEEVCSIFGVPPAMIGRGDKASSWASSSENLNLWFLQYALRPWMRRIEMAIWDGFLSPVERTSIYAEFAVEGLLRADAQGRAQFYSQALQNGWMSRNEVRALENLPKAEGGDEFTVQSNMIPLDQLGEADPIDAAMADAVSEPDADS